MADGIKDTESYMKGLDEAYKIALIYRDSRDIRNRIKDKLNHARVKCGFQPIGKIAKQENLV